SPLPAPRRASGPRRRGTRSSAATGRSRSSRPRSRSSSPPSRSPRAAARPRAGRRRRGFPGRGASGNATRRAHPAPPGRLAPVKTKVLSRKQYEKELARLQRELVGLQEWIVHEGLKVVVLFEGRDTAGKGGSIRRITEKTNPRVVRSVALATPSDRERTQW